MGYIINRLSPGSLFLQIPGPYVTRYPDNYQVVSPQLKRALLAQDRCCTYPSCNHEQYLEAHHVMRQR